MNAPILIFETDPNLGTPKLRPVNGSTGALSKRELSKLEDKLHQRYEHLVRDGAGTIESGGRTLHVVKQAGDCSRQPTLEIWSDPPAADESTSSHRTPSPALDWGVPFLAEIDHVLASDHCQDLLPVERAMLRLVRDELQSLLERDGAGRLAQVMLLGFVMTAEYLCRMRQPNVPHPYAIALGGLERIFADRTDPPTPWGHLAQPRRTEPAPTWLTRFWACMTRTS